MLALLWWSVPPPLPVLGTHDTLTVLGWPWDRRRSGAGARGLGSHGMWGRSRLSPEPLGRPGARPYPIRSDPAAGRCVRDRVSILRSILCDAQPKCSSLGFKHFRNFICLLLRPRCYYIENKITCALDGKRLGRNFFFFNLVEK